MSNKPLNILFIKDNLLDIEVFKKLLLNEGLLFDLKCVENETEFLSAVTHSPDVILSTWSITEFSGLRVLQLLKELDLEIPLINISSNNSDEIAVEALQKGAFDHLIIDQSERLGQAIRNTIQLVKINNQRMRGEEELIFLTAALNAAANAILITDINGTIEWVNPAFSEMTGYEKEESVGKNPRDLVKSNKQDPEYYKHLWQTILGGNVWRGELINQRKNGQLYIENQTITPVRNSSGNISHFIAVKQDITEQTQTIDTFKKLSRVIEQTTEIVFITDLEGVIEYVNPAFESLTGFSKDEAIGKTPRILKSGVFSAVEYESLWKTILAGNVLQGVVPNRKKNGDLYYQDSIISHLRDKQGRITHFVLTGKDITSRMKTEEESKNRLAMLEAVNQISNSLRVSQTLNEMLPILLDEILGLLHESLGEIRLYNASKDELSVVVTRGYEIAGDSISFPPQKSGEGIAGYVLESNEPYISSEYHTDKRLSELIRNQIPSGIGGVTVPIHSTTSIIGTITISFSSPRQINDSEIKLLSTLSDIAGNAIQRTSLKQQTEQQLQQLTSLREIDNVILSSFDLKISLEAILSQVKTQLGVDAADILIFDPISQTLNFSVGRGFNTNAIEQTKLRLGQSHAGNAALTHQIVHIHDLLNAGVPLFTPSLKEEQFISFYAVPLFVKGQIKGVLELFHRATYELDNECLGFLKSLAGQAAIAIDNSTLFEDLQHSNMELSLAYDATIEGWSRALDLRDQETEGHTQRVTDMAVKLSSKFGFSNDDLLQIRRGALLHDIGKMGVPDKILLKPGPLTDEEWVIMKKHPTYAFEMLSPIRYLRSAIDIPYCHHEKWDGTGYPRGLIGDQIPLSARIFALVDVWDALRSNRPYRAAWSFEKVMSHIHSLSGTHFDPKVLEICLESNLFNNKEYDALE